MRKSIANIVASSGLLLAAGLMTPAQAGDAASGQSVFGRCAACHQIGQGAGNAIGPHLNGLIGRAIASLQGFEYSNGLLARGGEAWSSDNVASYIADPGRFIGERSRMPAQRLRPDQVADLIAYLEQN